MNMAEKCHLMLIRVSGRVMVWPSLHIWNKSPGVWKRGWWVMSVKPGLGNGKAPHYTWHEHHGGRTVILVRLAGFTFRTMTLLKNEITRWDSRAGWQRREGWRALHLGMSSGTAVLGSSAWLKMQLSSGRRKARSLYEPSISVSPKPYSRGFIISATELGCIKVLKYKHLKATLQLKALGLMSITFYHALCGMCVDSFLKSQTTSIVQVKISPSTRHRHKVDCSYDTV